MVLLKKRANLSRYTISGTAVNQKHGGPMPVVCIYMFIEVYIICDCKAVFVMREQRESRSTRRGDLHSAQSFFLFTLSPFIERYITLHPCDVKDSMLNCIMWWLFFFLNHVICVWPKTQGPQETIFLSGCLFFDQYCFSQSSIYRMKMIRYWRPGGQSVERVCSKIVPYTVSDLYKSCQDKVVFHAKAEFQASPQSIMNCAPVEVAIQRRLAVTLLCYSPGIRPALPWHGC